MNKGNFEQVGIDAKAFLAGKTKKPGKFETVANMIGEGKTLDEVDDLYPGFVLQNKRRIEEYVEYRVKKSARLEESYVDWEEECKSTLCFNDSVDTSEQTSSDAKIASWLYQNIKVTRVQRQKQLWIFGATHLGKSYLIQTLARYLEIYSMPIDNWHPDFENKVDLIVFDEFTGQYFPSFMNKCLEGQRMNFQVKGDTKVKRKVHPVIVISNDHPMHIYKNVSHRVMEAMLDRVYCVEIVNRIDTVWIV